VTATLTNPSAESLAGIESQANPKIASQRRLVVYVGLISVLASLAILVLQQTSFRLLAPGIGSSVETWSTIVGVFLLGIAAGNAAGGRLADRAPGVATIRWCTALGGAATLLMLVAAEYLKGTRLLESLPLAVQIGTSATIVCFLPSFVLSLLTPLAIKTILSEAAQAGRVTGLIFALGTVGSLVGNYLTGFVLIPNLEIRTIVLLVAAALLLLSLIGMRRGQEPRVPRTWQASGDLEATSLLVARQESAFDYREACLVALMCSFVSGTLESSAFRMLAPLVGVSIYLSTGVIGVVLAGMSLGNYLGGRLADGRSSLGTLRFSLVASSLATMAATPILRVCTQWSALATMPLIPRILTLSFVMFFIPSLCLGLISPQLIRYLVTDVRSAGRVAGRIYAWSTCGCILGVLATAWVLIGLLGVQRLVVFAGLALTPLALVVGEKNRIASLQKQWRLVAGVGVAGLLLALLVRSPYELETRYFSIAVIDGTRDGRAVKRLVLDRLIHSEVDFADPQWLGYPHEQIQADLTRAINRQSAAAGQKTRLLVIGGGGYTLPKWVENQPDLRDVAVEVVEIDPGVTEVAHRKLGLARDTRIVSHHLDGRQFVKRADDETYDLVIQDAVNDFSVPYHIMTREYNELISRTLKADGIYLLTVIDSLQDGSFLRAALRTMQASFADVRLLSPTDDWDNAGRSVYVLAGCSKYRPGQIELLLKQTGAFSLPEARLRELATQDGPRGIILTDQYAPVDTLIARRFLGQDPAAP
jgi:Spermine/spermidine synthase domain